MTVENIKALLDVCYQAKRVRELLPALPKGVTSSYIHYLDTIEHLEQRGVRVKVSDISDALDIPRPGVTRTVKEMEAGGYLQKAASEEDGRITYLTITDAGKKLSETYNAHSFSRSLRRCWQTSRTTMPPAQSARLKSSTALCQRGGLPLHTNKADFTQGSILKKLSLFMLPILGALILQAAYGAVDLLVVGQFGSTAGLSAVSTGSQVLNLVTFVVTQLAMGVTVLIARYLGEQNEKQIGPVLGGAAVVFCMVSAVLFVLLVCFARPIAVVMQAPEEAVELTASYVRICGGGIFFIVAYNLLSAIFRGLGDSRSPLLFVLVACVVNVAGDLLLVAGFGMDAAGAAIATVFAQAVSVLFAVVILLKKELPFSVAREDVRINPQCGKFLGIGLPLALQEFLTQLSFLALCAFVNRLGLTASSGYGLPARS